MTYTMELKSGLHIGDSKESVEIGGVDSPVVRRKDNNQPYIPGSSLKGKIRSLLEISTGSNGKGDFERNSYKGAGINIPILFGSKEDPSRIIVRDASLTPEWEMKLRDSDYTDMPYTEIKFENVINRLSGTAEHPRQIERIPAGACFDVEFVINIVVDNDAESMEKDAAYIKLIESGIQLLEDDYLGGSGTRGYGKVKFNNKQIVRKNSDEYFS